MKQAASPRIASTRTATTFRLEPTTQENLVMLGKVLKTPLNRLVNAALASYAQERIAEVTANLEQTLAQLKSRRRADPDFESAIADFADSEARHATSDPAEGKISPKRGAVQTRIHALLKP